MAALSETQKRAVVILAAQGDNPSQIARNLGITEEQVTGELRPKRAKAKD